MKFLVVGASGFVGRNILAYVKALGHEAVGTQSKPRDAGLVTFDLLEHRIRDCLPASFMAGPEPVQVVISAVISNMDLCLQDRAMSRKVNVEHTIRLIDDVRALKAKPVFLSSCFVFDGRLGYYHEAHPYSPANEYGRHKVEVEQYLTAKVPEAFVARLDKIVGDDPGQPHLLAHWYDRLKQALPIVCLEGSLLSPTYVQDVAESIVRACQTGLNGIWHLSNSEFFYRDELARQFCYALGYEPTVENRSLKEFNFPDNRALKSYLDGSRFARESGVRFTAMREVFGRFRQKLEASAGSQAARAASTQR